MEISISQNARELGQAAARFTVMKLKEIIAEKGEARIMVSTGSSQFETIQSLVNSEVDWTKVEVFHLDEYIGLPVTHKASFRKYLRERFISRVNVRKFYPVDGEGDVEETIRILSATIKEKPVDLGLIGIGENAHIAFNDPPADFDTREPYIVVNLDNDCKMQQVREDWFPGIADVPDRAISMSVWQIMQCRTIVSCVPHKAKAQAIRKTFSSPTDNRVPATMLKKHHDLHLYLDVNSVSEIITF